MTNAPGGSFSGRVVIDGAKLAEILRGPNGPVVRRLLEAGDVVKAGARRRVGVYEPSQTDPNPPPRARKPGTLRDSIVKRVTVGPLGGVSVEVGSEDPIALLHHEGTEPHTITARNRPFLVFWDGRQGPTVGGGTLGGRLVRTRSVNHPGTKPNRYLTDSLADLGGFGLRI